MRVEIVDPGLEGHQLLDGVPAQRLTNEPDAKRDGRRPGGVSERPVARDGRDFGICPEKRRDLVAEGRMKPALYRALEVLRVPGFRLEDDVAARDKRFGLREAHGVEVRAKHIHLHDVSTDVDGAKERDEPRHGAGTSEDTS